MYLLPRIKFFEKEWGEKLFSKSFSLIVITFLLLLVVSDGCATATTAQKKRIVTERYRVGVVNGGTYIGVAQEAVYELSSLREIDVIKEEEINTILAEAGLDSTSLLGASSFRALNSLKNLDFIIVLLPAPPAYPVGSVGIRSINWRSRKIKTIPAVKVPENPIDWLLETKNGWFYLVSDPPGAIVLSNGNPIGITPIVMLVENLPMTFVFKWAEKVETAVTVQSEEQSKIYVRAPADYYAKHHKKGLYRRLQEADQQYGESVFVVMYVLVIVGGIALLFYNPFK